MEKKKWLVISYNLPTEPSRHRVATWRGLKKLGAVNIQQSMWVLAYNEENYKALHKIARDIEFNNGEALLMESVFFEQKHEDRIVLYFNQLRDEEYNEFIDKCEDYFKELEKEISIEKFTFAELEEEEEEIQKLLAWYGKIEARDLFQAPAGHTARVRMEAIKTAFEAYSLLVYQHNDHSI